MKKGAQMRLEREEQEGEASSARPLAEIGDVSSLDRQGTLFVS